MKKFSLFLSFLPFVIKDGMSMKKIIIGLSFISVLFGSSISMAGELLRTDPLYVGLETEILSPFFKALKDGNVEVIKQYISEDMYQKNRRLLDQNKKYPETLRKYYQDASIHTKSILLKSDTITVDVEIKLPGGNSLAKELHLVSVQPGLSSNLPIQSQWKIKELN